MSEGRYDRPMSSVPPPRPQSSALGDLAERLRAARRATFLTGAGVSAASGVPTFRGRDGLWKDRRPEDLATPEAFARDPDAVWEWYAWRRARVAACAPNPAHEVMARWSRQHPGWRVLTQNVDDLHVRVDTDHLTRLHGSIWELSCAAGASGCAAGRIPWRDLDAADATPRSCPHCGGRARPAVVWFGEALDATTLAQAIAATDCDIFLTVGTSSIVYPAAGLVHEAQRHGAFTVEINPDETPASGVVDLAIAAPAELVLPEVERLLGPPPAEHGR